MTVETEVAALTTAVNSLTSSVNVSKATLDESVAAAAAIYDSFDDRYLGAKSSAPSTDNDGNSLLTGALYFNSTENAMYVYTGASWVITTNYNNVTAPYTLAQTLNTNGNDVTFGDNGYATFGAGDDLQIYHNAGTSFITESGSSNFKIGGENLYLQNTAHNENYLAAIANQGVTLYYNNAAKLATTTTGIDVTGTATMDGLTVDGDGTLQTLDGAILKLRTTDTSALANDIAGAIYFETDDPSRTQGTRNSIESILLGGQANTRLKFKSSQDDGALLTRMDIDSNGDISFYEDTGTTPKLFWDASAESLGIGTSAPATALEVKSDGASIQVSSADYDVALLGRRGSSGVDLDKGYMRLRDTGTTTVAIDSAGNSYFNGGNVGIGISDDLTYPLTVKSDANNSYVHFVNSTTGSAFSDGSQIGVPSGSIDLLINNRESGNVRLNTAGAERLRIDSAGNVGVGTSSPNISGFSKALTIDSSDSGIELSSSGTIQALFAANTQGATVHGVGSSGIRMFTSASGSTTERMRIDSAGNLLVGKTTTDFGTAGIRLEGPNGKIEATRSNNIVMDLNRINGDGNILLFSANTSPVGSIGTASTFLTIGTGDTGLLFNDTSNVIQGWNLTTNGEADTDISLGTSDRRFKDLYLSGGVYLGGTGAANKLDDYEEGTWTPAENNLTFTVASGRYTKIGNLVHALGYVEVPLNTNGNTFDISLPFASGDSTAVYFTCSVTSTGLADTAGLLGPSGSGYIAVINKDTEARTLLSAASNKAFRFNITYRTA